MNELDLLERACEVVTWQWGIVIIASLTAAVYDLRTTRIPNVLTLGLAGAGVFVAVSSHGLSGLAHGVIAWIVLAFPYVVLFVLGRGGAGDAKMMGAIGVWLGLREGVVALCCVSIIGGLVAVLKMLCDSERRAILREVTTSLYVSAVALAGGRKTWNLLDENPREQAGGQPREVTIPYGVAIFLGVCLAACMVHVWLEQ